MSHNNVRYSYYNVPNQSFEECVFVKSQNKLTLEGFISSLQSRKLDFYAFCIMPELPSLQGTVIRKINATPVLTQSLRF